MKHDPPLFRPHPVRGIRSDKVFFIPVDSPSGIISKHLLSLRHQRKDTALGQWFRIPAGAVLFQCIGAPTAVLNLERLIASGARDILLLGFCGALSRKSKIGDCIVATKAFSEEGTSAHYLPNRDAFTPSSSLQQDTETRLGACRITFQSGTLVSTDAPFRETESWLDFNRRRGAEFVDMEASAVFALAEFYGIRAAAVMIVSDVLTSRNHVTGFRSPQLSRQIKRCFLPFLDA